jgi:polyisoprenoid-binding protein YceI
MIFATAVIAFSVLGQTTPLFAQDYTLDAAHAGCTFKISHLGLSWTFGRFKEMTGDVKLDRANPGAGSFNVVIKTESLDTDNAKRDQHLKSPDFLNTKQFPVITFQSSAIKAIDGGLEVAGNFTMHGVTKPLTLKLVGGRTAEFPKGVQRTGYSTEVTLRRSEFGIDRFAEAIGEDVIVAISFEAVKK